MYKAACLFVCLSAFKKSLVVLMGEGICIIVHKKNHARLNEEIITSRLIYDGGGGDIFEFGDIYLQVILWIVKLITEYTD